MDQETIAQSSTSPETIAASEASVSTSTESVTEAITEPTQTEQAIADVQEQINQFNPNYKFKVMDEEKEFDEFLRPVIKDEETQKKIKELYEKAYGLDYVKPKYESVKSELEKIRPEYQAITNDLKLVGQHLKNQDLGSFFKTFKLTDDQILEYAVKRLEYLEASPEKRKQIDSELAYKGQAAQISLENEQLKAYKQQNETNAFYGQLSSSVSSPEVLPIAQSFDSRVGRQGAFTEAVIQHGITQSRLAGRDLEVQEAVQSFIQTYGLTPQPSQVASVQPVATSSGDSSQRKETLPKVQASGGSPVAQKVKSLSDLKKLQEKSFSTGHG